MIMKHLFFTLSTSLLMLFASGIASATDFKNVKTTTGQCPTGYTLASYDEATKERTQACKVLGQWDIARLAGGGSMDGSGYQCKTRQNDTRGLGNALCRPPASMSRVYAAYNGSQQGVTTRNTNTLVQNAYFGTGIRATGITSENGTLYLAETNHIRKYNSSGTQLVNMTFPIASIIYTDVAVQGNRVYAAYKGSQQGVTIRDANTLKQISYFNTGIDAQSIAVDANNNIYLASANHLLKYSASGKRLVDMTFPITSIHYTSVAVQGNKLYASYKGSQKGVTTRDTATLKQIAYFNTGVEASGIAVDSNHMIYLAAKNHLIKYNASGVLQKDMTFPISSINYSDISVK